MKRNCLVVLVFCLFLSMSAFAAEVVTVGGLKYELNGSEAYVAGYEGNPTDVVIPATIESDGLTFKVTKVKGGAFRDCTTITSVKAVGSNLTEIGHSGNYYGSFRGCTSLVSVSFPYVKKIQAGSFSSCSNLQYVWLGYSLTELNGNSDYTYGVFYNCTMLSYIVIPASCTQMGYSGGNYTFSGCSRLQAIIYLGTQTSKGSSNADVYNVNNMLNWSESSFTYSGKSPQPTFTTNLPAGFQPTSNAAQGNLSTNVGTYNVTVPITFKNNNMEFEADIPYSYTINPARLKAKVSDDSRLYGDEDPQFSSTYTGFVNNEDASVVTSHGNYTTTATAKSDVGTYAIKQTGATAQNYVFEYEDGMLTVNKAPLKMTAKDKTMTYGSITPIFDAKYEGLKNHEYEPKWTNAPTISTTATSASKVGTYPITISNAEAKNYELTINNGTLTIGKAELTVTADNKERNYGDANPEFTLSYQGLMNNETVPEWEKLPNTETTASVLSPVGTYGISIKDAVAVNYNITAVEGVLTVKKAALQVIPNDATRKYGEDNPEFELSYVGLKNNESIPEWTVEPVIKTTATKNSSVGDYAIQVTTAEARNYTIEKKTGILNITKAPLSAKVKDATKVYGTLNPTFSIEYNGLKNGETFPAWTTVPTFQTEATKASGVGQYIIKAVNGVPVNYELEVADGTLSVTPASLTLIANDATRKYFEDDPSFTYSCTGFVNGDDVSMLTRKPSFVTDATKASNVGKYKITPSSAEAKNYTISYEQGELTITKRPLTATSHCSRLYGEDNPLLPIEYSGFVNAETENVIATKPIATTTATKTSSVGDYPIKVSGGEATNYDFVNEQGVLTVTKASLSAKVKDATKVYGAQNPSFSIDYYGLKNGETVPAWTTSPTFQTEATQASGVGAYTVKAVNGVPVNYDLGEITAGTLNITPAQLTIKANDAVRQYYSDDPTFSYTCNGFVNGDNESALVTTPKLSTTVTRNSNVGTYEIKVEEASSPNYSISYANGTLTITPRALIASIGNYERVYNEENPVFEVKYDGFVGNEDENVLSAKATVSTTATKTSDVGTYTITVSGGSADNYTFSYTSGILTINKAEQTISWEQDLTGLKIGDQVELKAETSSGLPITYTMDNTNAAELYSIGSKSYLDCKGGGQFLIRAIQNGNKNYYSSPKASNTVSIVGTNPASDPTLTIKQADNGSVKVQVSKGSVYTFLMAPSTGWRVHSVTFNDTDVTSQLSSDGSFTTPAINSNSTLSVVYEQEGNAINSTRASEVRIQTTPDGIRVIDGNMGDNIHIYTIDGIPQKSVNVDDKIIDIPLTKHDVYIIKVSGKTVKLRY